MTIIYRPLGRVSNIIQATGLEMSYAYDDLVFADNSVFLIRFDEKLENSIHLFFNTDCIETEKVRLEKLLRDAAKVEKFKIASVGLFSLKQLDEKEELEIEFMV